jgi:hypothetical protein
MNQRVLGPTARFIRRGESTLATQAAEHRMSQANSKTTTPEYTFSDVESDLQHLYDLVDIVVSALVEIDRGKLDSAEKDELNRVASLAWITRDQLELIKDRVSKNN